MIGTTHERPRFHVHKTQHVALAFQRGKLVRMIISHHWQVLRRRTQILPDRQQVTLRGAQIPHGLNDLCWLFTQAYHQPGLRAHRRVQILDTLEQLQRALVLCLRTYFVVEARDTFQVVVQYVRLRLDHLCQSRPVALEIGNKHLYTALRHMPPDGPNSRSEDVTPAVQYIVAVHRGKHRITQAKRRYRLGDPLGLLLVNNPRAPCLHSTEATATCACISQQHKRGTALVPALADIGAHRLLTHRMQALLTHQTLEGKERFPSGEFHTQPWRLALRGGVELHEGHEPLLSLSGTWQPPRGAGHGCACAAYTGLCPDAARGLFRP